MGGGGTLLPCAPWHACVARCTYAAAGVRGETWGYPRRAASVPEHLQEPGSWAFVQGTIFTGRLSPCPAQGFPPPSPPPLSPHPRRACPGLPSHLVLTTTFRYLNLLAAVVHLEAVTPTPLSARLGKRKDNLETTESRYLKTEKMRSIKLHRRFLCNRLMEMTGIQSFLLHRIKDGPEDMLIFNFRS